MIGAGLLAFLVAIPVLAQNYGQPQGYPPPQGYQQTQGVPQAQGYGQPALGQAATNVAAIKQNPSMLNEIVQLEGFVIQQIPAPSGSMSFYYLKDDWGGIIKVRTSRGAPEVGKRFRVSGAVTQDQEQGERYLHEESRSLLGSQPLPTGMPPLTAQPQRGQLTPMFWVLFVGILLVFAALIGVLLVILRQQGQKGKPDLAKGMPEPEEVLEGKTIKFHTPPPGTLKLLPGRLELISGDESDKVREIRFYRVPTQTEAEFTLGRGQGQPFTHIQLKAMTVSSKHAKLVYAGNEYTLINYSGVNPVVVNGKPLEANGRAVLKDGDRVEIGEVVFNFHAR